MPFTSALPTVRSPSGQCLALAHRMLKKTLHSFVARYAIVCMLSLLSMAQVQAQTDNGINQLRDFSSDLTSLSAQFIQITFDLDGNREESSGQMWVLKPDRLRWDYLEPYEQRIIADGEQVWTYDVDLDQVTVRPQGEALSRSALSALTDSSRLEQYFELLNGGEGEGLQWVRLLPRTPQGENSASRSSDHEFEEIRLGFREQQLVRMVIHDRLGQSTDTVFSGLQRNISVSHELFQFTPPAGVDVIGSDEL